MNKSEAIKFTYRIGDGTCKLKAFCPYSGPTEDLNEKIKLDLVYQYLFKIYKGVDIFVLTVK